MNRSTARSFILPLLFAGPLFLGACDGDPANQLSPTEPALNAAEISTADAEVQQGLATLRRATARYHRVKAALEDGFIAAGLGCVVPNERGALGIPYIHPGRLDANIDLSEPEVLFYEPQKNGKLRLVGAEPVVPIAAWDAEHDEPPTIFGLEFHRNEAAGLYGRHMWVWLHNPDGMFAFQHPLVSCEFAE